METEPLLDFVGRIYDTALDVTLWPAVLEEACLYIGGASAVIFWQSAIESSATVFHIWGQEPDYTKLYNETYAVMNPLYPAAIFIEPGVVVTGEDFISHEEIRQTRFFKEWAEPQGLIDAAGFNLQRYPTSAASFGIRRGRQHGIIDADARRRLNLIAPHICRAALIGRQIARSDSRVHDFETVLDASVAAVFLVGETGRVIFANQTGRAMLDDGAVVMERGGVLTARDPRAAHLLREAASGALPASEGRKSVSIALTETAPRWLADVLPLTSGSRLSLGLEFQATAAIFVRRAEIPAASGIEIMAKLYRLTGSEIRVLHEIANGGSIDDIAGAIGISSGTVKTHLNALFAKTGTNRRADLLREVAAHGGPLI